MLRLALNPVRPVDLLLEAATHDLAVPWYAFSIWNAQFGP